MKRWLLLGLVLFVGAAVAATWTLLRTEWAGTHLCGIAARAAGKAVGLPIEVAACRLDPARLQLDLEGVRAGPPGAPVLEVESVRVRLAAMQALGGKLQIAELSVKHPRLALATKDDANDRAPAACPPDLLSRVELGAVSIEDARVDLRLPSGARLSVARADLRADPAGSAWPAGPGAPRSRFDVRVAGARFEDGTRSVAASAAHAAGESALDLSRLEIADAGADGAGPDQWSVAVKGVVEDLCRPRLRLDAAARAPLPWLAALAGARPDELRGAVEARGTISGAAASPSVVGEVRLAGARAGSWIPGDVRARLALRGRELKVEALELSGRNGALVRARGTLRLDRNMALDAEADLANVELAEVLERCGIPGAWVLLRASGKAHVSGTLSPLALTGEAGIDAADFKALSHRWEELRPGEVPVLELRNARIEGDLRVSRQSVKIERAHLRAGAETLGLDAELFLSSERGFAVRFDGGADLSNLRHVASVPLGGRARVHGTARAAPYGNPRIEAELHAGDLRFLDLDLGAAGAAVTYGPDDHVIHATGIDGQKGGTTYQGAMDVDLDRSPAEIRGGRLAARGRLRDLFDAVMPWLPSTKVVRDALDAAAEVQATMHGPATALAAEFEARLGAGEVLGRPFDSGVVTGRVEEGARAFFRKVEIARAVGTEHAAGLREFAAPHAWELDAGWSRFPLGDALGSPTSWAGRADGTATIRGSLDVPEIQFTSTAEGVAVGGVPLRGARAEGRVQGERLTLSATAEGLRLTGTGRLVGDGPFEASAELDLDDLGRLYRPDGARGARLRVRGTASAKGVLVDVPGASADVRLDRLEASYADFRMANDGPVRLALAARRLAIQPFTMRGTNTALEVSGEVGRGGALALDAAGTLDLRIVGDSVPRVTAPHGLLAVEARVGGTLAEPLLVGNGHLRDAGFQFKDVPIAFSGLGGDLSFSHSRVLFDRLDGAVNGGRTELSGEVELVKLFPARVQIRSALEEVPLRIPEWLPSVVTGAVTVNGTWDSMDMGGRLHVVRARYTENVDLERSALEFRRQAAVGKAYDPAGEWLRFDVQLVVDGDARVENDLVRGQVRGEVTLTGTMGAPGLVGTLAMAEGSRATFRGNEFALSHAVVDYTERRAIKMHLDVHGETRVREYQVFMHVLGPYDAPVIQLTSQPSLTQEDLVALLSLGFTTRDAALSGTASGIATAAAAQALYSVSGLDEQVRRFMPRGGPLRDFTVRMTSAYSEGSGLVEPRAEFESKLLDDRLRFRWQAPLSAARGQRAQAELKLGGRASVQYQWENDNPDVATGGDHGLDLKLRWEWTD